MLDGQTLDDPSIPDDAELWRRIPPWHFYFDGKLGRIRPSKAAFEDDGDGSPMSVILAAEAGQPERALEGHEGYALAVITAGLARSCGQQIVRDPTAEEPAHAVVIGLKTDSIKRRFAREARWAVLPPDP
ncbi:MAG TPA: hypothetical protein VFH48_17800 [Chloroflexota bacterium]|nr:hypothetical protein [Chloroflexota bacterium]